MSVSLLRCVSCKTGVACRIANELRHCSECRAIGKKCYLLELNIPFNITDWYCDEHRESVYSGYDEIEGIPV